MREVTKEIWKPISGFEDLYEISNYGNVKVKEKIVKTGLKNNPYAKRTEKILKTQTNKLGYKHISLTKNGIRKNVNIHKVVMETFDNNKINFKSMPYEDRIKVDPNKLVVNHKDENPSNNFIGNLEWATQAYNINYGNRNKKVSQIMKKKYGYKVVQKDKNGSIINIFNNMKEAGEKTNTDRKCISLCCKGIYKQAGGYIWRYYETNN